MKKAILYIGILVIDISIQYFAWHLIKGADKPDIFLWSSIESTCLTGFNLLVLQLKK